jgi:hypothetical protein
MGVTFPWRHLSDHLSDLCVVTGVVTCVAAPGSPFAWHTSRDVRAMRRKRRKWRMRIVGVGIGVLGAALVVGAGGAAVAVAPEADLAYHGYVAMSASRVDVRFTPQNHGPSGVTDATVRLHWSVPLADRQRLPADCARSGTQTVLCRTGVLAADAVGEEIRLGVRLAGAPTEVTLTLDTVWGGGAVDRNHGNDRQQVLALDTGDLYFF